MNQDDWNEIDRMISEDPAAFVNAITGSPKKETGGAAFPNEFSLEENQGMTLRDYFAAKCDIAAYAPVDSLYRKYGRNPTVNELAVWIAEVRFIEADAMLAERAK